MSESRIIGKEQGQSVYLVMEKDSLKTLAVYDNIDAAIRHTNYVGDEFHQIVQHILQPEFRVRARIRFGSKA